MRLAPFSGPSVSPRIPLPVSLPVSFPRFRSTRTPAAPSLSNPTLCGPVGPNVSYVLLEMNYRTI